MQHCSLQHRTLLLSPVTSTTGLFLLRLYPFTLSGVISPLFSISILGTYQCGEFLFQYPINLLFPTVHGVFKARILKWFAIPFSNSFSHIQLFETLWTVAHHTPQSRRFGRQEYWSGLPCPPLVDLPNPGMDSRIFCVSCIAGGFFTTGPLGKPPKCGKEI